MAVLSQRKILDLLKNEELTFSPEIDSKQLQSHAVDLRLGFTFMLPRHWTITKKGRESIFVDPESFANQKNMDTVELEEGQFFEIIPGEFVIASTLEEVGMPTNVMAVLYPRSSQNRKGLSVSLTGVVDAGYKGNLVIPIENKSSHPIRLYPGERFCQLTFEYIDGDFELKKSRYHEHDISEGVLPEKDQKEIDFIKTGNLQGLKDKYPLPSSVGSSE